LFAPNVAIETRFVKLPRLPVSASAVLAAWTALIKPKKNLILLTFLQTIFPVDRPEEREYIAAKAAVSAWEKARRPTIKSNPFL
jgi:hypothetical protein